MRLLTKKAIEFPIFFSRRFPRFTFKLEFKSAVFTAFRFKFRAQFLEVVSSSIARVSRFKRPAQRSDAVPAPIVFHDQHGKRWDGSGTGMEFLSLSAYLIAMHLPTLKRHLLRDRSAPKSAKPFIKRFGLTRPTSLTHL